MSGQQVYFPIASYEFHLDFHIGSNDGDNDHGSGVGGDTMDITSRFGENKENKSYVYNPLGLSPSSSLKYYLSKTF